MFDKKKLISGNGLRTHQSSLTMHIDASADKLRWLPASAETDVTFVDMLSW